MDSVSERDIRGSFANCSKGEAQRANLPADLGATPWPDLDFLGWVDPKSPLVGYLVVPAPDHGLVGLQVRRNLSGAGSRRARMCSICSTTHSGQGVALMVARRAGRAGREGNSVGLDICSALDCSLHARGLIPAPALSAAQETLTPEEKVTRLRRNLFAFVDRALRP